jgi:hypothetical protein
MTPKEKAEELFDKFNNPDRTNYPYYSHNAQQCALIAVAELIYFSSNQSLSVDFDGDYYCDHDFFVEVKKEIEAI